MKPEFSLKEFEQATICLSDVSLVPDIDECSSENECHMNATCTNTIGSYNCTCKKGYGGDGRTCAGKVQSNEGTIATEADSFVLHALRDQ